MTVNQGVADKLRQVAALLAQQGANPFRVSAYRGPQLAQRVHDRLGIDTLEALEIAAHDGRLEAVPGFGARRATAVRGVLGSLLGTTRTVHRGPRTGA